MNHPDLKATHTFDDDERVRPTARSEALDLDGNSLTHTFPAYSLTIRLEVRAADPGVAPEPAPQS